MCRVSTQTCKKKEVVFFVQRSKIALKTVHLQFYHSSHELSLPHPNKRFVSGVLKGSYRGVLRVTKDTREVLNNRRVLSPLEGECYLIPSEPYLLLGLSGLWCEHEYISCSAAVRSCGRVSAAASLKQRNVEEDLGLK